MVTAHTSCALQLRFGADQTSVELVGLIPATDYSVTLYALYDEEPSDPITAQGATGNTSPSPLINKTSPGVTGKTSPSPLIKRPSQGATGKTSPSPLINISA